MARPGSGEFDRELGAISKAIIAAACVAGLSGLVIAGGTLVKVDALEARLGQQAPKVEQNSTSSAVVKTELENVKDNQRRLEKKIDDNAAAAETRDKEILRAIRELERAR